MIAIAKVSCNDMHSVSQNDGVFNAAAEDCFFLQDNFVLKEEIFGGII